VKEVGMADRVLFISWGENVAGREQRGLALFNEVIGMYGTMQQEGRIESFDVVLLNPNAGIDGYIEIRGSAEQLNALRDSDDYLRSITAAGLVVHDLRVVEGFTGAGIARMVEIYGEAVDAVPQMA
jgi:hypothetical protein